MYFNTFVGSRSLPCQNFLIFVQIFFWMCITNFEVRQPEMPIYCFPVDVHIGVDTHALFRIVLM